ncbi:MAG TPA: penicillin-binding protein 2 [Flavisolibacter sp.]|jgi:penicillin-binding protein 2|nr:penicillin-binding protein 2 [Flavisolibacter sp.]
MSVFTQSRSYIVRIIFAVVFLIILIRLFTLQVMSSKYQRLAQENAVFKKIVYPARGIIYDRKGKAIVTNTQMTDLMVVPSEARGVDTAYICQLLDIDTAEFKARMLNAIIKNGRSRPSAFESLLTPEKHARLEENSWRLGKGFYLQDRPVRIYPEGVGGHFVGYIGEVDSAIIARSEGFYQMGDYVGRTGLESTYEKVLMGQRGVQYLIKDNRNKLVGRFENGELDEQPIAGRGLHTYVDVELQQLAEKLMQNKVGAIVAIEPKTGGILSMVSGPNFNPNQLTGPEFKKTYGKFVLDVSGPLLNRAIKGQYPPGSTFKPLGALVALDERLITPSFGYPCGGRYYACGHGKPACTHAGGGHAADLRRAIANSCNSYFVHIYRMVADNPKYGGVKNGYHKWKEYMNAFGLGLRLGIDLPSEDKGNIPDTAVYNRVYRNSWNSCTNLTLGIGQDMMTSTPLQLANAMCIIANKGYYYTPHFVKSIDKEETDTVLQPYKVRHDVLTHISDSAFNIVMAGMQDVVTSGTARSAAIPGVNICAKTGTAQNFTMLRGKKVELNENSMFVAFAPRENPKIAIAVVVENAGYGSTAAGPIASLMIEKYLNDTLSTASQKKADAFAQRDLMPSILKVKQYIEDSLRARYYFNLTKDSNYIKKYLRGNVTPAKKDTARPTTPAPERRVAGRKETPANREQDQTVFWHRNELWDDRNGKKRRSVA